MKKEIHESETEKTIKRDGNAPSEEKEKREEQQGNDQNGGGFSSAPEEYAPVENMEQLIYGPPEMFEKKDGFMWRIKS